MPVCCLIRRHESTTFASDKESAWRGEKLDEDLARTATLTRLAWPQKGMPSWRRRERDITQSDLTSVPRLSTTVIDHFDHSERHPTRRLPIRNCRTRGTSFDATSN